DREMNNVLGAKSGYTCCYVNMHQGWTKFAQHLWYGTRDKGLAALVYGPNTIRTHVGEQAHEITIKEDTEYPFGDTIKFTVGTKDSIAFPLKLRIPSWCDAPELTVNGEKIDLVFDKAILTLKRTWKNGDVVNLKLPMEVRVSEWAENS